MSEPAPLVVFSSVDDRVSGPSAVSSAALACALKQLEDENVSFVMCSSKTRAELELIHQELHIRHPFICENGAAAFIPQGYFGFDVQGTRAVAGYEAMEFGRSYSDVVDTLHQTAERTHVRIVGFSNMSVEQVARECNLSVLHARLAKLREYEEPFRVLDPDAAARSRLLRALRTASLRCVRRGRYDYVGAAVDMRVGVHLLCGLYRRAYGPVRTVGVGSGERDEAFLGLVDYPANGPPETDAARWIETIVEIVRNLRRDDGPSVG